MSGRTAWGDMVPKLVRQRTMGFLIGNGLSRLCGAPSWGDLFSSSDVLEVLKQERVSPGTPYLELGYLLSQQKPVLWDGILRRLYDWANACACDSRAHRALLQVLRPGQPLPNVAILTTNVDSLLENYGYRREHIGYIHGQPGEHANWIFTADEYWNSWNSDKGIGQVFKKFQAAGVLFLGYGHSNEDFDIIQTVIELRKQYFGRMYTLMTQQEAERGELRWRLNWQGIEVITYEMPLRHPTQQERDLFLTKALLDLAEDCELHKDGQREQPYQQLREWCDTEISRLSGRRASAAIVLGLAGVNRHAALPGAIPTSERRDAEAAEIRVEPGGPGYIVSAIGRALGIDSFLVSKIASDEQGEFVQAAIRGHPEGARIFSDFVEVAPPGPGVTDFRTWDSFILEPNEGLSHRVFIDRKIDGHELDLSSSTRHGVAAMLRDRSNRVFYFDRHYRDAIVHVLQSAIYKRISESVWTVYETDSDGGRYGFKGAGAHFDKDTAYDFEKRLAASQLECINVVVASFRFARDCLAVHYGKMPRESYEPLISRHDTPEIVGSLAPAQTEDEVIAELVRNEDRLNAFAEAVRKGANQFLRHHPLRLVVVTLHRLGSLAVTVPAADADTACLCYVDGIQPPAKRLYTASAGDVFRGVLVSALAHAQRNGLEAADVMKPDFLKPLLKLCNQCAGEKVVSPTLIDCLGSIKQHFDCWARQPAEGRA